MESDALGSVAASFLFWGVMIFLLSLCWLLVEVEFVVSGDFIRGRSSGLGTSILANSSVMASSLSVSSSHIRLVGSV